MVLSIDQCLFEATFDASLTLTVFGPWTTIFAVVSQRGSHHSYQQNDKLAHFHHVQSNEAHAQLRVVVESGPLSPLELTRRQLGEAQLGGKAHYGFSA